MSFVSSEKCYLLKGLGGRRDRASLVPKKKKQTQEAVIEKHLVSLFEEKEGLISSH